MGITAFYGDPMAPEASLQLLHGVQQEFKQKNSSALPHYDTAEVYKTGNPFVDNEADLYNEQVLRPFFASIPRDSFTVATKFMPGKYGGACDYDTVKGALERSLGRLGLAYVDVYYCHRIPSLDAGLAFAESCKRLVSEGLMRHTGLSEINGRWLRQAHAITPIIAVQQEWSLMSRSLEAELVPACAELVSLRSNQPKFPRLLTHTYAPFLKIIGDWNRGLLPTGTEYFGGPF